MSLRITFDDDSADGDNLTVPVHITLAVLGTAVLLLVIALDLTVAGRGSPVLQDAEPLFTPLFVTRGVLLIISALLTALALTSVRRREQTEEKEPRWMVGATWLILGAALLVPVVLLVSPASFTRLGLEDGPVENISAVLLIGSAGALFVRAIRARTRHDGDHDGARARQTALLLFALAAMYGLLGFEEISWGQRLIGFDTPEVLGANAQGETNLHNFATNALEVMFYGGTAVFFVAGPWLRRRTRPDGRWAALTGLLPPSIMTIAIAPAAAMNYDLFNVAPVQWCLWLTVAVVVSALLRDRWPRSLRVLATCGAVVCLVVQAVLVLRGDQSTRLWDATEYRELFTALALATYAAWLVWRRT